MNEVASVIAIILVFVAYIPYLRDTVKGKTKPHVYSWLVLAYVPLIMGFLQLNDGGGSGSFVALSVSAIGFTIFALGMRSGEKDITKLDTAFLIAALVATGLWLLAEQPALSATLLISIGVLGFVPTVRKSWHKPHQETLFTWVVGIFRHALSIFGLANFTYVTLIFPVTWTLGNLAFSLMLIIRLRQTQSD